MKITKPNITEGEWDISKDYPKEVRSGGGVTFLVARCENPLEVMKHETKSNAKAISAVPNMIDALIEAQDELERFVISKGIDSQKVHVIKTIKSALEKAGCTYEP